MSDLEGLEFFHSARSSREGSDEESSASPRSNCSSLQTNKSVIPLATPPPYLESDTSETDADVDQTCCCSVACWIVFVYVFNAMGLAGMIFGFAWMCATCPLLAVWIGLCVSAKKERKNGALRRLGQWLVLLSMLAFVVGMLIICIPGDTCVGGLLSTKRRDGGKALHWSLLVIFMVLLLVVIPCAGYSFFKRKEKAAAAHVHSV